MFQILQIRDKYGQGHNDKMNTETGCPPRRVDMGAVMDIAKMPSWSKPKGAKLFQRTHDMIDYVGKLVNCEMWHYNRQMLTGPNRRVLARDENNNEYFGVNMASADYLGLAQDERAKQAAIDAAEKYGMNSAGSPSSMGAHPLYQQLEKELSEYWETNVLIYPTGWMAGFGVIKGLIQEGDFIIMDQVSHNCLQEGAFASTKNVSRFEHMNQQAMAQMLKETREKNPDSAIMVVTEGLFSMDADSPDVNFYQKVTKKYGAFLLLDCAHDFGHLGHWGKGSWEVQGVKDMSNVILVGTGSKCLSTNIGFIGIKDKRVTDVLRHSPYFSSAVTINPAQAATSLTQLRILSSIEGVQRRRKVTENYHYLRKRLEEKGRTILGSAGAIMIVFVGNEAICRILCRMMMDMGVHVNGIEYPVVRPGKARLRVGLMPQHTKEDLDTFADVFERGMAQSEKILEESMKAFAEKQEEQERPRL